MKKTMLSLAITGISAACLSACGGEGAAEFFDNVEHISAENHPVRAGAYQPLPDGPAYTLPETFVSEGVTYNTADFLDETGTEGLVITHHGAVVYEQYMSTKSADDLFESWSMGKSVLAALVGMAIEDGYIGSVHDKVKDYLPAFSEHVYANSTIEDLLTMSSGVYFNEYSSGAYTDAALSDAFQMLLSTADSQREFLRTLEERTTDENTGLPHQPGDYNDYKSSDSQMLTTVLHKALGKTVSRYLEEKLWGPAGMRQDASWMADKEHIVAGFCCLKTTTRDMAKFGNIFMDGGRYEGQQLIPEQWVLDSLDTSPARLQAGDNPLSASTWAYGYHWWMPPADDAENAARQNDFLATGLFNQYLYVMPSKGIVIAKHSAPPTYFLDDLGSEHIDLFKLIGEELTAAQ